MLLKKNNNYNDIIINYTNNYLFKLYKFNKFYKLSF